MSYKRLTKYSETNEDYITPYCDTQNCNGVCRDCDYEQVIVNRLAKLENKIENGTLIELPCKVGDKIYFETWEDNGSTSIGVKGHKVASFEINAIINGKYGKTYIPLKAVGIDVFLTKAEAEKKLEELRGGK